MSEQILLPALLHAHVTELIALTHIREFCSSEALNRLLWGMHPESYLFIPGGLAFIPYDLPGTTDIALASALALQDHSIAIWEKHGVLATGTSVAVAFDNIDLLATSAHIYFMVKGTGYEPEGLTERQPGGLGSQSELNNYLSFHPIRALNIALFSLSNSLYQRFFGVD